MMSYTSVHPPLIPTLDWVREYEDLLFQDAKSDNPVFNHEQLGCVAPEEGGDFTCPPEPESPKVTFLVGCSSSPQPDTIVEINKETAPQPVTKKRKKWGQELPTPTTNLPPRKRAKTAEEKEQRRIERILRNRAAAQSSRERKQKEAQALEEEVANMVQSNADLRARLAAREKANNALSAEVEAMQQTLLIYEEYMAVAAGGICTNTAAIAVDRISHPPDFEALQQPSWEDENSFLFYGNPELAAINILDPPVLTLPYAPHPLYAVVSPDYLL
ncbi:hypothetical protein HOY80DRAFT_1103070 [Tuber brumale]|nr:hypothetical protein HOY80DRAFT_1006563 [Tuber brumale]KAG0632780.1 hypothetical protein HOY80DRAFT_739106 [Tuber brumale]KAG0633772.1 hypothetical protein HOY80DRAFT_1103070 [Tuber brumale]